MNALDYIRSKPKNSDLQWKLINKLAATRAAKQVEPFDEHTFPTFVAFARDLSHSTFSNALLGRFGALLSFSQNIENQSIPTDDILRVFTAARQHAVADKIASDIRTEILGY